MSVRCRGRAWARRLAGAACAALFAAVGPVPFAGCTATVVPPDGLDDARVRSMELERRVKELEARNAELSAELAAARDADSVPAGEQGPDAEVREATPRLVSLALAGASSEWSRAAEGDPRQATVHIGIEARDGLSRSIQVAGRCEVTVAFVDPRGGVRELGRRSYAPGELRAVWRSGFMGAHYALEVPVAVPVGLPRGPWSASVSVTDGWTGRVARWSGAVPAPIAAGTP